MLFFSWLSPLRYVGLRDLIEITLTPRGGCLDSMPKTILPEGAYRPRFQAPFLSQVFCGLLRSQQIVRAVLPLVVHTYICFL